MSLPRLQVVHDPPIAIRDCSPPGARLGLAGACEDSAAAGVQRVEVDVLDGLGVLVVAVELAAAPLVVGLRALQRRPLEGVAPCVVVCGAGQP